MDAASTTAESSGPSQVPRGCRLRFPMSVLVLVATSFTVTSVSQSEAPVSDETRRYLASLDPARMERNGCRYTDPDMSPFRILPTLTPHDVTFHYDFERLRAVETRLRGVDRRTALRAIFDRVTKGAATDRDRHLAVLRFLHRASFHNLIQPMHPDGRPVYDPLVLLELGEMRCGHVNRVAADLFASAGYRAHLVQVAFHLLAEVWYDDTWHYFDGDIFGNGETARLPDGRIPSMEQLSHRPELLDALTAFWEPDHTNSIPRAGAIYPSWFYFGKPAYRASAVVPEFIEKRATAQHEARSDQYGWESEYDEIPDPRRRLYDWAAPKRTPGPPQITAVTEGFGPRGPFVRVEWSPDARAIGYRVLVGRTSRGWNYSGRSLPPELIRWKSGPGHWQPEMYEARYRLPPADLACLDTVATAATLPRVEPGPMFISVMGYDEYGARIGRRLYPLSEELKVP